MATAATWVGETCHEYHQEHLFPIAAFLWFHEARATRLGGASPAAISRGAMEDPDEAPVSLDCGHFVRRDRRLGIPVDSTAAND